MNKCKTTPSQLKDLDAEISIMRKLRHESIISLYEVVASATSLYIILELVRGGDLFHMISKLKHYSETVAAQLMANFMSALDYMHKQVLHCDRQNLVGISARLCVNPDVNPLTLFPLSRTGGPQLYLCVTGSAPCVG